MIASLIQILVVCILAGLVYWVVDAMEVPNPLNKFVKVVVIVIGVVLVCLILLGLVGYDTGVPFRR
jgi:hypothetical protein